MRSWVSNIEHGSSVPCSFLAELVTQQMYEFLMDRGSHWLRRTRRFGIRCYFEQLLPNSNRVSRHFPSLLFRRIVPDDRKFVWIH